MCQNTTTQIRRRRKGEIAERYYRWMLPEAEIVSLLQDNRPAPLRIKVRYEGGKLIVGYYWVWKTPVGWRVAKEGKSGNFSESYTVDTTFDEDPGTWQCDCYDATHYGQQCKHKFALIAALKRVGYLKP